MPDPFRPAPAASTRAGLAVPRIGFGTSALGDMPNTYGYSVDEERARATVRAILESPFPLIDTSRLYGFGRSEERIGAAIRDLGGLPAGAVISTKLDRDPDTGRFDGAEARRSLEASLKALGLPRVDILHLHDPEWARDLGEITRPGGAIAELLAMREEGFATAVGLAAGNVEVMMPLLRDFDFDVLITHNRFTLVNGNAEPMMDLAMVRGILVMNAAPYAGGALAKGTAGYKRYVYQEASDAVLAPIRRVEEICDRHGVPPGAAALQFSLRDPRVASTICGVSKPERVAETLAFASHPIPDAVWEELAAVPRSADDPEATRQYDPG
jgi:D-threo-aldose 1-dehydrogenase